MRSRLGRGLAAVVLAAGVVGAAVAADPPAPSDPKAFDKVVVDTLRDVHNKGADLYNQSKDYVGAYRLYEGSLRTVKPFLAHRPAVQRTIEDGLAAAERETDPARRAFLLHETIERVRADLKGDQPAVRTPETKTPEVKKAPETKTPESKPSDLKTPESKTSPKPADPKKPETKTPESKPADPKKPDETKPGTAAKEPGKLPDVGPKKSDDTAPPPKAKDAKEPAGKAGGTVSGTVTLNGKPLPEAEVTFVSLDRKGAKPVTAKTDDDGKYTTKDLPPGKYAVAVEAVKDGKSLLPPKYATTDTSGITAEVKAGSNPIDLSLMSK